MRARGQGLLTVALLGAIVLGSVGIDRLGAKAPAELASGTAPSGAWFCPHGGGPDWSASVYLANPGENDVDARLTSLGEGRAEPGETVTVPAGGEVRLPAPAAELGSSSYVEYFGGWIAAGWVTRGASREAGVGAEPCAPTAGRSWFSSGVSTAQGERGSLVVMNPFGADAVFDVAIFAASRQPVRPSRLRDVTLAPERSLDIKLNTFAEGESALSVEVQTSSGRVAVATTVQSKASGIASVLAWPSTSRSAVLPTISGGQSTLSLAVPTDGASVAGAQLLTEQLPRPVGELTGQSLEPASAALFPVVTGENASVDVTVQEGEPIVAALRTTGPGSDDGASGGAFGPASAWVVLPALGGEPARPLLLLANPGDAAASVTLRLLPLDGGQGEVTIEVPAATLVSAPASLLAGAPDAAVLVTSQGSPIVAGSATTSLGRDGRSVFALAAGVPIPQQNG